MVHAFFVFMKITGGSGARSVTDAKTCLCKTYYASVLRLFHAVLLSLRHEICFHADRFCIAGVGDYRYIFTAFAHHTLSIALGCDVFPQFAARLQVASRTQISRHVHTQFPRGPQHTAARQDSFFVAAVAYIASLYSADIRFMVAPRCNAGCCLGRKFLHIVVQDAAQCRLMPFLQLLFLLSFAGVNT